MVLTYFRMVATMAVVSSFLMQMSPMGTVRRFWRRKTVGSFPFLPYIAMLANGVLGFCYGLTVGDTTTCVAGTVATVLPATYVGSYLRWAGASRARCVRQLGMVLALCVVVALAAQSPAGAAHDFVTLAMCCAGFAAFASPLVVIRKVLREGKITGMALSVSSMNFFCAMSWTLHALNIHDVPLLLTNGLGLLAAIAQLSLFAVYPVAAEVAGRSKAGAAATDAAAVEVAADAMEDDDAAERAVEPWSRAEDAAPLISRTTRSSSF